MVDVNLFSEKDAHVSAQVLGGNEGDAAKFRFIALRVGPLGVILAGSEQARAIAEALTVAAIQLEDAQ